MPRNIFQNTSTLTVALTMTFGSLTGCNGPTTAGKEARNAASVRMNVINAQVQFDQARQSFEAGQFDKATREIKFAIARYPDSPAYYVLQGRVFLETHQLESALNSFNTAIKVSGRTADQVKEKSSDRNQPSAPKVETTLRSDSASPALAEAHYFSGIVHQRWSDDTQAYQSYLKAYEVEPTNPQYLLAAAESLISLGQFDAAAELVSPKMAYFEHNAALRQLQGQIALLKGDPKKAASLYAEARLLNPDDTMLLAQLMWAQYASGMYGPCLESVRMLQKKTATLSGNGQRASNATPEVPNADLIHMEARCLKMMGRGPEARDLYINLSKLSPTDATVWTELAALAWDLGDFRRVALSSVQVISLVPDRYEGYMFKGINERERGNLNEAATLFRQSTQRNGGSEVALPHLLLGQTMQQCGDFTSARTSFQQALRIEPGNSEAAELLRRLDESQRISSAPTD